MINKIIKLIDKLLNTALTITFVLVMLFGFYAIYDMYQVNDSARLSSDILNLKPEQNAKEYSLTDLQKINSDIVAWLRINNTTIDYPVVIGMDNTEYLDKNYKHEFSITGSIFLDYRNNHNFDDDYSIIYGHNMKADVMFSDIKKYENPEFFNTHKTGVLYTSNDTYKIEIISNAKVSAYENKVYNLISNKNKNNASIIEFFDKNVIFKSNIEVNETDKLLLLSTCDETSPNEREVVLAKLIKADDNSNIIIGTGELNQKSEIKSSSSKVLTTEKEISNVSIRDIALTILTLIVIIIFIILIIQKRKINKNNSKRV